MSETNKASNKHKAAIAVMCNGLGIDKETKSELVRQFSNGRTVTSKELSVGEAKALIKHLSSIKMVNQPDASKMVRKIMYYAHLLGWTKFNKAGRKVADGKRIDEWMLNYSYLHKKLSAYSYSEMPKLVSQFEAFYKTTLLK